jgi:type I restriction enzyme S subunit
MSFDLIKLKDLSASIIDGDRSAKYPKRGEFQECGVVFLNSTNISDGRLDLTDVNYITEQKYLSIKKGRVVSGDIVMTTRGSIGKVARIPAGFQGLINAQMLLIRADEGDVCGGFLFHWFRSDHGQLKLKNFSSGAAQPQIPIRDLQEIEIGVPPLSVQRPIASILSAYDDLIENNTRRIAILEETARRIYEEWFVRFRFPGHEQVRMVESQLGLIPEGWRVAPITEVSTVRYGKNLSTKMLADDGDFPVYGASKVIGRYTEFTRENRTLIVGCRGSVGVPQITLPKCFVTNNSFTVDPAHPQGMLWLFHALQNRGLKDVVGGAAQPQITLEGISNATLVTPTDNVIELFGSVAQPLFELAWNLGDKNANLRTTQDLLLPKLLSGELDVSTLPEPETIAA